MLRAFFTAIGIASLKSDAMENSMNPRLPMSAPGKMPVAAVEIAAEASLLLAQARNAAFTEVQCGRVGLGLGVLQQALEQEPMSHELLSDMAALLLATGELQQAVAYASQALVQRPGHGPSLYTLAFAQSGLGELQTARMTLTDLLSEGASLSSLRDEAPCLEPVARTELARLFALERKPQP